MKRMTPEEAAEWRRKSVERYRAKRQKPTTPQRARKQAEDAEYRVNRERRIVQARGRCEFVRDGERCPRPATQTHHVVRRSQNVDHSVSNLRRLCLWDHQFLHLHVALAKEWGWIKSDHPKIGEE